MSAAWPVAKLRSYLTAIVVLSCAPLALLMAWFAMQDLRDREQRLLGSLQDSSRALAALVEADLTASADWLDMLAAGGLAQRLAAPDGSAGHAGDTGLRRASWHSVFVDPPVDASLARGSLPAAGRRVAAVTAGPDGEPAVRVSVDADGGRRLGAWIKLRHWQALIAEAAPVQALGAGGFVAILDERQRPIVATQGNGVAGLPLHADAAWAAGGGQHGAGRGRSSDGEAAYAAWQQLGFGGWRINVGVPAAPFEQVARTAVLSSLAAAAACLLLGVTLALGVSRRVAQPLAALARGDAGGDAPRSPVQEVSVLQRALADAGARSSATTQKLQDQADELDTAFETSPVAMALCLDAGCKSWRHNRAMRSLLGTWQSPLPEMLREGRRIEPADRALLAAAGRGLSTPAHEQEWRFGPPVGTRWVLVQAEPLLDAGGRPRGAVEAVIDITAIKQGMQRLTQTRDRLLQAQHLIDAAQLAGRVGFFRYDFAADELHTTRGHAALFHAANDGPLLDSNGHAMLSAGVALQAPQTLASWLRLLGPADRLAMQRGIAEMSSQHKPTHELNLDLPAGSEAPHEPRHASARLLMRFDSAGLPAELMGIVIDTSEQQRAVQSGGRQVAAEQQARQAAEAASTAKDELLAIFGHELRNPLNALSAAAEVLKSLLQPGDPLAAEARDVVERQARQLTRMTNEFLDLSRLTGNAAELDLQPTNLHAMAAAMVSELRPAATASGRSVELRGSAGWMRADRDRIGQMLRKLFDHALARAGDGGCVHVHVQPEGRGVLLRLGWRVRQTSPLALAELAEGPLSDDAQPPDAEPHGGLTLGIEWAGTLAKLHGSRLEWRHTADGAEAALRFEGLPLQIANAATVAAPPAPAHGSAPPRTLLLVEDNEDAAQSLGAALQLDGHRVTHAADGVQGLSLLLAQRPEVAIVDLGLPGIGGLALARQARGAGYSGRLIALSGHVSAEGTALALRAGFDAFVAKPADLERLNALIASPG